MKCEQQQPTPCSSFTQPRKAAGEAKMTNHTCCHFSEKISINGLGIQLATPLLLGKAGMSKVAVSQENSGVQMAENPDMLRCKIKFWPHRFVSNLGPPEESNPVTGWLGCSTQPLPSVAIFPR